MKSQKFLTPKFKTVTYLGRRAEVTTIGKSGGNAANSTGERIVIFHWLDDADEKNGGHEAGTVVVKHIRGDGRHIIGFHVFSETVVATVEDALALAAEKFGLEVPA